jgi:uncharacterized protein (DUF58 family)
MILTIGPGWDDRRFIQQVRTLSARLASAAPPRSSQPAPGLIPARAQAEGTDFLQSRPYHVGDPLHALDWRVTARTGQLSTKQYEPPRQLMVQLLVDRSASMCASGASEYASLESEVLAGPPCKYAVAVQLAGAAAFAWIDWFCPVGLLSPGAEPLVMRPSLDRGQAHRWLRKLRRCRLDLVTTLAADLRHACRESQPQDRIILITDLHDPQLRALLPAATHAGALTLLWLVDPAERDRMAGGFFRADEAETGRLLGNRWSPWLDLDAVAGELDEARVPYIRLDIDRPFLAGLLEFLRSTVWTSRRGTRR